MPKLQLPNNKATYPSGKETGYKFFGWSYSRLVTWPVHPMLKGISTYLSTGLGVFALSVLFSFIFFGISTRIYEMPVYNGPDTDPEHPDLFINPGLSKVYFSSEFIRVMAVSLAWGITTAAIYFVSAFSDAYSTLFSGFAVTVADACLGRLPKDKYYGYWGLFASALSNIVFNFAGIYVGFLLIVGQQGGFETQTNRWGYYSFPDDWSQGHRWGNNIINSAVLFFFLCHTTYMRFIDDSSAIRSENKYKVNKHSLLISRVLAGIVSLGAGGVAAVIMGISCLYGAHNNPFFSLVLGIHTGRWDDFDIHMIAPAVGAVIGSLIFALVFIVINWKTPEGRDLYVKKKNEDGKEMEYLKSPNGAILGSSRESRMV